MIYKINNDYEQYKIINIEPDVLFSFYSEDVAIVSQILGQPGSNISLLDIWKTTP